MQSRPLQPVRQGHLDRLRRPHRRSAGARARVTALHVPLARTATPLPTPGRAAPGRAARPRTRSRAIAFIAAITAFWLAAIPVATSASATSASTAAGSATSPSTNSSTTVGERQPRLMAAGDASGTPFVTALISVRGNSYGVCSAGAWKPTVLLTAAHCVIDETTGGPIDPSSFFVVNPGTAFRITSGGVEGATPARVVQTFVTDDFQLRGTDVPGDDIAFVVLDQGVGDVTFSRLATTAELGRWLNDRTPVSALGYGFPSPASPTTDIPRGAALPLLRVLDDFRNSEGLAILSSKQSGIDACSGDSGGPRFVIENNAPLLLGNIAGGSCNGLPGAGVIGFTGMSYRTLANAALATAGLPLIPSRPQNVQSSRVEGTTTVWWDAPADSLDAVVAYDVLDTSGALLCSTADTTCSFPTGAGGVDGMTVRGYNAQGEGDANLVPTAEMLWPEAPTAKVLKASSKKKPVRIRFSAVDYPAVTSYHVTTPKGKVVCRIDPATSPLECRVKRPPGKHRFRVEAITEYGASIPSPLSAPVRVPK